MKLSLVMRRLKISGGNSLANDEENKNEEEEGGKRNKLVSLGQMKKEARIETEILLHTIISKVTRILGIVSLTKRFLFQN